MRVLAALLLVGLMLAAPHAVAESDTGEETTTTHAPSGGTTTTTTNTTGPEPTGCRPYCAV